MDNNSEAAALFAWKNCLDLIKDKINPITFSTWFEPLAPVSLDNSLLTIEVPSTYFYEWLEEHYFDQIQSTLKEVLGKEARLQYAVRVSRPDFDFHSDRPVITAAVPANETVNSSFVASLGESNILNPKFTFDNFLKGEGNQFARAAALNVAKNPSDTAFNPLVLYGGIGLGKTHLIQAIGNHVSLNYTSKKVVYVSSEKFTIDFVDAIERNSTKEFSTFYRSVDVLIVDDIQFFSGKERTQDMFFHTFNALSQQKKQIILSSDRPPKDLIGLDDRLISRFQCGLTVDIQPPDLETRIAILRKKSQDDHIELSQDVINYISTNVKSNIRELEGCYISLIARHTLENRPLDLDLAKVVLRNVVSHEQKELTIEQIQRIVADYFKIPENSIRAKTRKQEIVVPRQIAMYLAKNFTRASLKTIGLHFGGRDHSTIIYATKAVENDIKTDVSLKNHILELERQVSVFSD